MADHKIVIIGTGFAGICMAIKLLEAGISDFIILEKSNEIGGTWRDNTYPGAACDVISHLYSFSFEPNPEWSRMFAQQEEILAYTRHCVDKYGLRPYIRFGKEVSGGTFDELTSMWHIHVKNQADVKASIWINGMGPLNRAVLPDLPGLDGFNGEIFHSAHWRRDVDLSGKRVAVVGTGASAIQIVPNIAHQVKELHLFQRTAAWVLPKPDRPMKEWEKKMFRSFPLTQRLYRLFYYWINELTVIALAKRPSLTRFIRLLASRHMKRARLSAELMEKLTPDYTIGCKRILPSNDFYPTFKLSHVHLHTKGIERVRTQDVVTADGGHTEVDVIIMATGFMAAEFPSSFVVKGLQGRTLASTWTEGPEAYLGTAVSDFPNMFFIIGPNTGLGHSSMIIMIEAQVKYILSCITEMGRRSALQMNVKQTVQISYNEEIQQRLTGTVWNSGCVSWYRTSTGKNTSLWPGHTFEFMSRTSKVNVADYEWV
jgi:cation diffusion facilitator CzcD-associated flavoprotein CzcO